MQSLPPELLQQIKEAIASGALNLGDPAGRSPFRPRQLHDLTLVPTKDDPRPTFFWSAEKPRDVPNLSKVEEFPKLMWEGTTGTEITVISAKEQQAHLSMGYVLTAPANAVAPDPMDAIRAAFEALPPEDQQLLIEAQRQDRIHVLRTKLAGLDPDKLESLLASVEKPQAKKGRVA